MKEVTGTLTTTRITNDEENRVFEICREFDRDGEEAILVTLYPTLTEPNNFDLSSVHLINHSTDEGLNFRKIHFVFLFSKVVKTKMSTRGLTMDVENMCFINERIAQLPNAKIIISFGSSMQNSPAVIESKVELFKMIKELRPKETLWQIDAEDMEEESPHILFLGIRYNNQQWDLCPYTIPHRYTEKGYAEYLANKEIAKERFIQNVLGRKKDTPDEVDAKPKKGKKKSDNTES